ncbi:MAG: RsmB/NOP family class I SAM-dependent RNA methyltransferase [DPANN group archaeon]|nr:RsmB/NOP family class I SAM-dependent RNA methyltransferase [DPANN group archaeon]
MSIFLKRYEELGEKFNPEKIKLKTSLRVNTLKISEKELISRLEKEKVVLKKIPFLDYGYYCEADFSLGATPEYLQGYYYLQEAASQIPVMILKPSPNDLVLDMSAAPGGKTTQITSYMNNKGTIIALDNNVNRLEALRNNIERLGVKNVIIYKKDSRFVDDLEITFDKILLDAPCSGNFADEKNWFKIKTLEGIKEIARLQRELLKAAVKVLKKNGVLVYSTCSLEPEENELNINWLLSKYDDLELEELNVSISDFGLVNVFDQKLNTKIKKCRRFWPHKIGTQGFFIAKIRRK